MYKAPVTKDLSKSDMTDLFLMTKSILEGPSLKEVYKSIGKENRKAIADVLVQQHSKEKNDEG